MKPFSLLVPIGILAVAAILLFSIRGGWNRWVGDAATEKTNDAYVTADQIPLSTRISGTVHSLAVSDYQSVHAGQPLLALDDDDYRAMVAEARAAIAAARAALAANADAKQAADASIAAARAAIQQAQASRDSAGQAVAAHRAQSTQAASEFQRQQSLLEAHAATRQQFEQAQAARDAEVALVRSSEADLARAAAAVVSSQAALAGALAQRAGLDAKDAALRAQLAAKDAALTISKVNLSYTQVTAPADGQVGKLQVHPGQLVGAGVEVLNFVRKADWVEANFLETQMTHMRPGDAAKIRIDAYPSEVFHGHVAQIAPASGAASSLLPPDNATGNFTKVVQRVPVKISFDEEPSTVPLRPGLSAEVSVHVR